MYGWMSVFVVLFCMFIRCFMVSCCVFCVSIWVVWWMLLILFRIFLFSG